LSLSLFKIKLILLCCSVSDGHGTWQMTCSFM